MPPITLINEDVHKAFWKADLEEAVVAINGINLVDLESEIIRLKSGEPVGNTITAEQIIKTIKSVVLSYDIEGKKPLRVNDVIVYHMHPQGAENHPSYEDINTWDDISKTYRTYFAIGQQEGLIKRIRLYRRVEKIRKTIKYLTSADYLATKGLEEIPYNLVDSKILDTIYRKDPKRSFTACIELPAGRDV